MSTSSERESEHNLFRSALDTLSANVVILDGDGSIVATNQSWREFTRENGIQTSSDMCGCEYLESAQGVDDADATRAAAGISAILNGERDRFEFEYPYHSASEQRWFLMRASPFEHHGERYVTVAHTDITVRKVREITLRTAYEIGADRDSSFAEKVDALLDVAREAVGTEYATFSRVEDEEYTFEAVTAATDAEIDAGETVPLDELPNCKQVTTTQETLVLRDVAAEAPDLADPEWGISSYLGTPVTVDGEVYGTFCFYSMEARTEAFSEWEVTFVDLLGSWVSYELEHKKCDEKLQHLRENITDVVWMSSPERDEIEFISDSYEDIWGRSPESLQQDPTSFIEAIHPEDRDHVQQALEEQQTHPDDYEEQYRVVQPNGDVRWIHNRSAGVYTNGNFQRIVGVATDITDRKEREQHLAYQRTLLEAQSEATIDGVLIVDSNRDIRYHNSKFLDLWGISEKAAAEQSDEALLSLVCDRLVNPDEFLEQVEYLYNHPNAQSRDTLELTDGQWRDRYSAPVIGNDGTHYGRMWIFRDITEQKARETALTEQRDELAKLQRVNKIVRRSLRALQDTAAREEIETAVCEALTESDLYPAAWFGVRDETTTRESTVRPRTAAGLDESYLEGIPGGESGPAATALYTGETQVIDDIATAAGFPEARRETALAQDYHTLAAVPLVKDNTTYGVLVVYGPANHTFSETEQDVLTDLGRSIALAIQRVHSQDSLTAETRVALDLRIPDTDFVFGRVSAELDADLSLERRVSSGGGTTMYYLRVESDSLTEVCDFLEADSVIAACNAVRDEDSTHPTLVEVHLEDDRRLPIDIITDYGGAVTRAQTEDGDITLRVELPLDVDIRTLLNALREVAPPIELISKQHVERTTKTAAAIQDEVTGLLSEKQAAALESAYARGYYSWPREITMEELAETFDLSAPTLHYRLRKAHDTVIGSLLETP